MKIPNYCYRKNGAEETTALNKLQLLFWSCLKIGTTGFGGFVALVAIAERELAQRLKLVSAEDFAQALAVAALLPGSFAVNTIAIIGYQFAGFWGAQIVWFALILPSIFLVIAIAALYQEYHQLVFVDRFLQGLIPAVVVIIAAVIWQMGRKNLRDMVDAVLMLLALITLFYFPGFEVIIVCMLGSAFVGMAREFTNGAFTAARASFADRAAVKSQSRIYLRLLLLCLASLIAATVFAWLLADWTATPVLRELFSNFSLLSVSLFGGGYVAVPMMRELVVVQQQWLNAESFSHAIAIGQSTPGPVMVSATFIGYVVAGVAGAVVSTVAVFLPPVLLSVLAAEFSERVQTSRWGAAALIGLRPAVIALLLYALYTVGITLSPDWVSIALLLGALALTVFLQVPQPLLILLSAVLSLVVKGVLP